MSTAAPRRPDPGSSAGTAHRRWLACLGALLMLVCVVPPVLTLARRYVFVESAQFLVLSMAGPALAVLGGLWRPLRLSRVVAAARRVPGGSWVPLLVFAVACLVWRLPPVMDALARHPLLLAAEVAALVPAGTALWLELVVSPPLSPRARRPQRAVMAALAMWANWACAYALGFAAHGEFHAYHSAGGQLSAIADQEVTVGLVWAVAGVCFVPVVFVTILGWLGDNGGLTEELAEVARPRGGRPRVRGWKH